MGPPLRKTNKLRQQAVGERHAVPLRWWRKIHLSPFTGGHMGPPLRKTNKPRQHPRRLVVLFATILRGWWRKIHFSPFTDARANPPLLFQLFYRSLLLLKNPSYLQKSRLSLFSGARLCGFYPNDLFALSSPRLLLV